MKILLYIVSGIAAVVGIVLALAAMEPREFRVEKSVVVNATPDQIFPLVNNLKEGWDQWSPWAEMARKSQNTFSGPATGVGSKVAWRGNTEAGEGSLEITAERAPEYIKFHQEMVKPMAGANDSDFTLKPQGSSTLVTWRMVGEHPGILSKAIWVVWCKRMIGGFFEEGLGNLKRRVEG